MVGKHNVWVSTMVGKSIGWESIVGGMMELEFWTKWVLCVKRVRLDAG